MPEPFEKNYFYLVVVVIVVTLCRTKGSNCNELPS